jgi:nucleotide-binding universal stress UspA family protein
MKILFAVDGSAYTVKAAQYLASHFRQFGSALELHLLHVHLPIPPGLALAQAEKLFGDDIDKRYYSDESKAALAPAEDIFRQHGIAFRSAHKVGDVAQEIHRYSSAHAVDMIVMGSHGHGALGKLLLGSVATKVMALESDIPVLIVR